MIVGRTGLLDVGFEHVAVLCDVDSSWIQSAENFSPFPCLLSELEHPHLVLVTHLGIDNREVTKAL